jgi:aspartate aminotransferase-like enzyme
MGRRAREMMRKAGLELLSTERDAAPTIATFPLPSAGFAQECLCAGFRIAHESDYLRTRGWGQIATMGNLNWENLEGLFAAVKTRETSHHP